MRIVENGFCEVFEAATAVSPRFAANSHDRLRRGIVARNSIEGVLTSLSNWLKPPELSPLKRAGNLLSLYHAVNGRGYVPFGKAVWSRLFRGHDRLHLSFHVPGLLPY